MHEWIVGRNPVYELLRARRRHGYRCLIAQGVQPHPRLQEISQLCHQQKIKIETIQRSQLDTLAEHHQGIALETNEYPYSTLPDILRYSQRQPQPAFLLALDMIQNPQNLGTLIRSAEALGVHGILLPLAHTAGVTPAVVHASSGATEHMRIAQTNLAQALAALKENGLWAFGLDADTHAQPIEKTDLTLPLIWIVGNEGEGIRALVRKQCDQIVSLSMSGKVDSFNAATAGSIALYLTHMSRLQKTPKS